MRKVSLFVLGVVGPLLAIGCGSSGPELARVQGTVKLDGAPLPEAMITFVPAEGRPSFGVTDSDGNFDLLYTTDRRGALPGEHVVRVSTQRAGDPESGTKGQPERVPAKFNKKSEIKKTVEPGSNTIDIEVSSKDGKVVPPID